MKSLCRHWALYALAVVVPTLFSMAARADLDVSATEYRWDGNTFSVPLEIRDNAGVQRSRWPVTTGVPLPYGVVQDVDELRLTDERGQELPCQLTVLSRYWARDGSVRWVLLDFQTDLPAKGWVTLRLRNDRPQAPLPAPIVTADASGRIMVNTGPLKATISRSTASLFESVSIGGEKVMEAAGLDGPFLRSAKVETAEYFQGSSWNTHGWEASKQVETVSIPEALYSGSLSAPYEVSVESSGPMHAVVLVRGRYSPLLGEDAIPESARWNFTIRLHFYRGHSFVRVEYAIENSSRERPQWLLPFHEAGLTHSLNMEPAVRFTGGGRLSGDKDQAPVSESLYPGEEVWLRQQKASGRRSKPAASGYRLSIKGVNSVETLLDSGKNAGFVDVSDSKKGIAVTFRYFREKAPRAINLSNRQLQLLVHAEPSAGAAAAGTYELDFAARSIDEILYYFHSGDATGARVADVSEAFQYPLFARAPLKWYADTEAWYFEIYGSPAQRAKKRKGNAHWRIPDAFWQLPPKKPNYNSGGHHSSLNSGWLGFMLSGDLQELEENLALSERAIAYNPGWAYQDNRLRFGSGSGSDRYEVLDQAFDDWDRLTGFGSKAFYLWKSDADARPGKGKGREGKTYLNQYKYLPDHEHYAFFRLFEYYYLTGDRYALDAIHGFVNWDLNFQHRHLFKGETLPLSEVDYFDEDPDALRRGHYSRVYSWMLYTNLAGFQATGSPVMDEFARWQIRRMLALLRHRHGQLTSWKPKPGKLLGFLPGDWQDKIARHVDLDLLRQTDSVIQTGAKTWMEAQGVLALHEAYKTYGDERILDGLWGLADYFSHHVLFYPRLGMINHWTFMPSAPLGREFEGKATIYPRRHDRMVQAWPILYHYTGWPEVAERYRAFEKARKKTYVADWFLQTGLWERHVRPKASATPPRRITDLQVLKADRSGIRLRWTSPADDGAMGRAARYFVKYSRKPIVEFAPTDDPMRDEKKKAIVRLVDGTVDMGSKGKELNRKQSEYVKRHLIPEAPGIRLEDPDWDRTLAFWMAEHVAGEPEPAPAGTEEDFTIRKLKPHDWFGVPDDPGLEILESGTYYFAICTWDEDRNLSRLSNVVSAVIE